MTSGMPRDKVPEDGMPKDKMPEEHLIEHLTGREYTGGEYAGREYTDCLERVIRTVRLCKKAELAKKPADFTVSAASLLREELDVDSLDILMLAGELEEEFDITINDSDFAGVRTVGDIADKLAGLAPAPAPGGRQ